VKGLRLTAAGIVTGWGEGTASLPEDARAAAGGRAVIAIPQPTLDADRFRRSMHEGMLGVAAIETLLREGSLARTAITGTDTALIYVTAGAYGASNRAFLSESGQGVYFPYTAASAVPAEVTIEFGLFGEYVILIGGAPATLAALGHAARLLRRGACARALVLAVETFGECQDLYASTRWLLGRPLVEAAACVLLEPVDRGQAPPAAPPRAGQFDRLARRRAGETLSAEPLIALALARDSHYDPVSLTGAWRGRRASLAWSQIAG
jgi:hypothetical protein